MNRFFTQYRTEFFNGFLFLLGLLTLLGFQNCGQGFAINEELSSLVNPSTLDAESENVFERTWPNNSTTRPESSEIISEKIDIDIDGDGDFETLFLTLENNSSNEPNPMIRIVDQKTYNQIQNFQDDNFKPLQPFSFFLIDLDENGKDEFYYLAEDMKTIVGLSMQSLSINDRERPFLSFHYHVQIDELETYVQDNDLPQFESENDPVRGPLLLLGPFAIDENGLGQLLVLNSEEEPSEPSGPITPTPFDNPITQDQSFTINENEAFQASLDARDPENDPITYITTRQPNHGSLVIEGDNFTYTPNSHYFGVDSFAYQAEDIFGHQSQTTEVVFDIREVIVPNSNPTGENLNLSLIEDDSLSFDITVSDNDSTDILSIDIITPTSHGTLTSQSNFSFLYTPDSNFSGTDFLIYEVRDQRGGKSIQYRINLQVDGINDPPQICCQDPS